MCRTPRILSKNLACERHHGAYLHLLSAVSFFNATKCRTLCLDKKCPDKKLVDERSCNPLSVDLPRDPYECKQLNLGIPLSNRDIDCF